MGGAPSMILPGPEMWLGGEDALRDSKFFDEHGIRAVLSICQTVPDRNAKLDRRLHINIFDTPFAKISEHFWDAIQFIHEARANGFPVYVHCAAGISRSTSMVCVYLMTHLGMSFDAALRHTVACRSCTCPNDGFQRQIIEYERSNRDQRLQELHLLFDSKALLESDWKFIRSTIPDRDAEEHQNKLFKALMARKKEAGEHFGLEWLRQKMESQEEQAGEAKGAVAKESDAAEDKARRFKKFFG